jgi:hypothetical protein
MGVPVKSNNTQQGCNPISSNCVIWQGPDIPCINLCTGDSVSDVVAKMATELCEIADQLDISLLDLSCFNPLCPTPQNFRDVMQLIIDKICALENGTTADGTSNVGCPSDCIVTVAPCLQMQDYLGNTITTMALKDYVILIGNKICTILTTIAGLQLQIDGLDVRVTNLENNTGGGGGGSSSFNVTSNCITQGSVSLQEYISLLDRAFCDLLGTTGNTAQFTSATSASACVTGNSVQMANPPQLMGNYQSPSWIATPQTAYQQIQNLWVAICDIRTGLTNLKEQLTECCTPAAACPTNLPAPSVYLAKGDNNLYFSVSASTTGVTTQNAILLNGEEWRLVRFEGTAQASANGNLQQIIAPIPINASATIDYSGSTTGVNQLFSLTGLNVSIEAQVTGIFYWQNVATGQECSVIAGNAPKLRNDTVISTYACPSFTSIPPKLTATTAASCNNQTGGAAVTVAISGTYGLINGVGVTTASMPVTVNYTSVAGLPATYNSIISTGSTSIVVTGVLCGTTVTVSTGNVSQGNASITPACSSSIAVPIPVDLTP